MENKNSKIENFFSQQLKEIKEYHNKVWGKVYTERTREGAINRCLELADFDICLEDIQNEQIKCKCGKDTFGYVCVNPSTKFFFVVSICDCEQKGGTNEN
jgi:hypothetical protein